MGGAARGRPWRPGAHCPRAGGLATKARGLAASQPRGARRGSRQIFPEPFYYFRRAPRGLCTTCRAHIAPPRLAGRRVPAWRAWRSLFSSFLLFPSHIVADPRERGRVCPVKYRALAAREFVPRYSPVRRGGRPASALEPQFGLAVYQPQQPWLAGLGGADQAGGPEGPRRSGNAAGLSPARGGVRGPTFKTKADQGTKGTPP